MLSDPDHPSVSLWLEIAMVGSITENAAEKSRNESECELLEQLLFL